MLRIGVGQCTGSVHIVVDIDAQKYMGKMFLFLCDNFHNAVDVLRVGRIVGELNHPSAQCIIKEQGIEIGGHGGAQHDTVIFKMSGNTGILLQLIIDNVVPPGKGLVVYKERVCHHDHGTYQQYTRQRSDE